MARSRYGNDAEVRNDKKVLTRFKSINRAVEGLDRDYQILDSMEKEFLNSVRRQLQFLLNRRNPYGTLDK